MSAQSRKMFSWKWNIHLFYSKIGIFWRNKKETCKKVLKTSTDMVAGTLTWTLWPLPTWITWWIRSVLQGRFKSIKDHEPRQGSPCWWLCGQLQNDLWFWSSLPLQTDDKNREESFRTGLGLPGWQMRGYLIIV